MKGDFHCGKRWPRLGLTSTVKPFESMPLSEMV
jgi:hypothetical protein